MARFVAREHRSETGSKRLVAGLMSFAFASALFTEVIGIHALFGAFLAGAIMPNNPRLRSFLRDRLETFTTVLLLPLFFAFTGLRTQVGFVGRSGKLAAVPRRHLGRGRRQVRGSSLAAWWTGHGWKRLGRHRGPRRTRTEGLVELIVLNIGYDMGILSPRIFAMMVLMALITTFMAGPLLLLLGVGGEDGEPKEERQVTHTSARAQ